MCKKIGQNCVLVVDSNGYVNPNYENRGDIVIQGTSQLAFSFIIKPVHLSDAGIYTCQAGDDSSGDKYTIDLQVLKPEPELLYGDLRGSVTFDCSLGSDVKNVAKFLCRMSNGKNCDVVINSLGKKAKAFEGRILLTPGDKGLFRVHITSLRKEDAGHYLCGAHSDGQPHEDGPFQAWQLFVNEGET